MSSCLLKVHFSFLMTCFSVIYLHLTCVIIDRFTPRFMYNFLQNIGACDLPTIAMATNQAPSHMFKSLQLIWKSNIPKWRFMYNFLQNIGACDVPTIAMATNQEPSHMFKSLQLIWKSNIPKWRFMYNFLQNIGACDVPTIAMATNQEPSHMVKSLQLQKSNISRWNLLVPDFQMGCKYLT